MKAIKKIRKAVFPVAGMGTRFLPATKATPKEMLPVVDKPLIQYAVEEAIDAGITDLVFVTSYTKTPVINHFDKNFELEYRLEKAGKNRLLEIVKNIIPYNVNCFYIRQAEALGLGHAVDCAKHIIGDESFAVILADDLMYSDHNKSCLANMIDVAQQNGSSVVAVEQVPVDKVSQYGVINPGETNHPLYRLNGVVEKPKQEDAPSNLAIVGRYILRPEIFSFISDSHNGAAGEIQLTDAIEALLGVQDVFAYEFEGTRYDCGSKIGYMKANVDYALRHPEIEGEFHQYLKQRMS